VRVLAGRLQLTLPPTTARAISGIEYSRNVVAKRKATETWKHEEHKRKLKARKLVLYEEMCSKLRGDSYLKGDLQKTLGMDLKNMSLNDIEAALANVSSLVQEEETEAGRSKYGKYKKSILEPDSYWTCNACQTQYRNTGNDEQKRKKICAHLQKCKRFTRAHMQRTRTQHTHTQAPTHHANIHALAHTHANNLVAPTLDYPDSRNCSHSTT